MNAGWEAKNVRLREELIPEADNRSGNLTFNGFTLTCAKESNYDQPAA